MNLRNVFFNQYGRLRSGFRTLIFVLLFLFIEVTLETAIRVAYALLHDVLPPLPYAAFFQNMIYRGAFLTAALVAGYLCTRLLEGLPWRALGLTLHDHWLRHLLIGSLIGIGSLVLAAAIALVGGGLKFELNTTNAITHVLRSVIASGFLFFFAALGEEALFRGYPLQTFARAHHAWIGVLLTCVFFGLVHLANPNVVPGFTLINTIIAGIWLGIAYLRTRSLWFPLGVHWGWNWAMGSLFGIPVSGLHLVGAPLLKPHDVGPEWLTGGSYGLEGGIASTIVFVISILLIWKTRAVSAPPEMLRLTSEEVSAFQSARTQDPLVQHTPREDE